MNAATAHITPQQAALRALREVRWLDRATVVVGLLALALVLAAAAVWLARRPAFALQEVSLQGRLQHNHLPALRAQVLPRLAGSFFTLDLQAAREAVQALPWVRRAVVRRQWPDRLAIEIEEHTPRALWEGADGEDRLVNAQGELFEVNLGDVDDEALPRFTGPRERSAEMLALYERLAPVAAGRLGDAIERVALSERGSWRLVLASNARVELGRGAVDELTARATRFFNTVPAVAAQQQARWTQADLRHGGGYALKLVAAAPPAEGASANL